MGDDVMQLRRPMRFVPGEGISNGNYLEALPICNDAFDLDLLENRIYIHVRLPRGSVCQVTRY